MAANEELVKGILAAVNGTAREQGKMQEYIRTAIGEKDHDTLVAVCEGIESKYPKKDERNARLSILRTQMSRACGARGLDLGYRLTVKKLNKAWRVVQNEAPDEAEQARKKLERELADVVAAMEGQDQDWLAPKLVEALQAAGYEVSENNAKPAKQAPKRGSTRRNVASIHGDTAQAANF